MTPPGQPVAECTLPLPTTYRRDDLLAFHARDPQRLAEHVHADGLDKGLMWQGRPARLSLGFQEGVARLQLHVDGPAMETQADFPSWASRLLGLDQPAAAFEAALSTHPLLGPLIRACPDLRIPQAATPFEALAWAIIGQQISLAAAITLRSRFIEACGCRRGDLACFPDADAVLALSATRFTDAGLSRSKAAAILAVAGGVRDGSLPLDDWWNHRAPAGMIRESLLAIRGIGPWTTDYTLLRGFGHADASLHGDVAVRRGLQTLLGLAEKPSAVDTAAWLEAFSPWRTLVAAHLWHLG